MPQLSNKVAIITGASPASRTRQRHPVCPEASVVLGARRQPELDALGGGDQGFGGQAVSLAGDAKSEALRQRPGGAGRGTFRGLDVAFNNAGTTGTPTAMPGLELAQWQETLDTNLTSAFVEAEAPDPAMQARGRLAYLYLHLRRLFPGAARHGGLCRKQSGLIGLTQVLAAEYGGTRGGSTPCCRRHRYPMGRAFTDTPESLAFVQNMHAPQAPGPTGGDVCSDLYLASDASSFTTVDLTP